MVQSIVETIIESGFQAVGWVVLKAATFGRYRGFQPEDMHIEGGVGLATVAMLGYGGYRLLF
jgi:hypothetical protein